MPSATREALQRAIAALGDADVQTATGAELLAAARAMGANPQLRTALGDPSGDPAQRQQLAERVFASLSPAARGLVTDAVGSRWSSPRDLVVGIEELGIRAAAQAAGEDARVEDELFQVGSTLASDAQLELAVGSKLVGAQPKLDLVEQLFAGKVSEPTLTIVRHLVHRPVRIRMTESLRWAQRLVADQSGFLVGTATVAQELPQAQLDRLQQALSKQYGRRVRLNQVLDPAVLGGVRVQLGDDVIDGTVSSRLADLRLQLAG